MSSEEEARKQHDAQVFARGRRFGWEEASSTLLAYMPLQAYAEVDQPKVSKMLEETEKPFSTEPDKIEEMLNELKGYMRTCADAAVADYRLHPNDVKHFDAVPGLIDRLPKFELTDGHKDQVYGLSALNHIHSALAFALSAVMDRKHQLNNELNKLTDSLAKDNNVQGEGSNIICSVDGKLVCVFLSKENQDLLEEAQKKETQAQIEAQAAKAAQEINQVADNLDAQHEAGTTGTPGTYTPPALGVIEGGAGQ